MCYTYSHRFFLSYLLSLLNRLCLCEAHNWYIPEMVSDVMQVKNLLGTTLDYLFSVNIFVLILENFLNRTQDSVAIGPSIHMCKSLKYFYSL